MHLVYGYLKLSNPIGLYGVSTCIVHSYRDNVCYMYMCAVLLCLVCLFNLACFFLSSFSSLIKNMYNAGLREFYMYQNSFT